eukprot:1148427-Pelagomonas_calceolata.AAC.2
MSQGTAAAVAVLSPGQGTHCNQACRQVHLPYVLVLCRDAVYAKEEITTAAVADISARSVRHEAEHKRRGKARKRQERPHLCQLCVLLHAAHVCRHGLCAIRWRKMALVELRVQGMRVQVMRVQGMRVQGMRDTGMLAVYASSFAQQRSVCHQAEHTSGSGGSARYLQGSTVCAPQGGAQPQGLDVQKAGKTAPLSIVRPPPRCSCMQARSVRHETEHNRKG